jgi:hypothetical protein
MALLERVVPALHEKEIPSLRTVSAPLRGVVRRRKPQNEGEERRSIDSVPSVVPRFSGFGDNMEVNDRGINKLQYSGIRPKLESGNTRRCSPERKLLPFGNGSVAVPRSNSAQQDRRLTHT